MGLRKSRGNITISLCCIFSSTQPSFPWHKGLYTVHTAGRGFLGLRLQSHLTTMAPQPPKGQHIPYVCLAYFNWWRISPVFQVNSVSDYRNYVSSTSQHDLRTVLQCWKGKTSRKTADTKPRGSDHNQLHPL